MLWWKKYTVLWPFSFSYSVTHLSHHHLMDHPAAAAGQVGSLPRIPTTVSHVVVVPVCHPRARVARPPWLRMRLNECGLDAVSVLSERVGVSCSGSERWLAEWRSVVSWIWLRTVNDSLDSRQRRRTPFGWRRHITRSARHWSTVAECFVVAMWARSFRRCRLCAKNVVEGRYQLVWRSGLDTPRQALGHACHRRRLNCINKVKFGSRGVESVSNSATVKSSRQSCQPASCKFCRQPSTVNRHPCYGQPATFYFTFTFSFCFYLSVVFPPRLNEPSKFTLLILLLIVVGTCPRPCRDAAKPRPCGPPRPCDPPFGRAQLVNY